MAIEDVPWFIGADGVLHSAETARVVAYAASDGADGVVRSADLKVAPTGTPSSSVTIAPGAVSLVNRYPGAYAQSYIGVVRTQSTVAIDPTSSSGGRSDLVIARVRDPQYASVSGYNPNNPNAFNFFTIEVVKGVSPSFTKYSDSTPYPAVALARIDIPASTATITSAMIKDLRFKANTRSWRRAYPTFPTATQSLGTNTAEWLTTGQPMVPVPTWATRCNIIAHMAGVEKVVTGYVRATVKLSVGGQSTEWISVTQNSPVQRFGVSMGGSVDIPPAQRGTVVPLSIRGVINVGPNGAYQIDTESAITFDIEFVEETE